MYACAVLVCAASVSAQDLPRLHITALGMHADRARVAAGETYHVTIHVHITERRDRLDELQLPALTNAIDLGDERRRLAAPDGGTDFYEIMTVSSPDAGTASFSPAYVDAIDPARNRGMRYSSQSVSVRVTSGSAAGSGTVDGVTQRVERAVRDVVVFGIAAFAVAAVFVMLVLRRSRRPRVVTSSGPEPVGPEPVEGSRPAQPAGPRTDPLRDAARAFRERGDDASLDALRTVLFVRAGVQPGATLIDALQALGGSNPPLARAMAIAERVRFGPQSQRAAAAADLTRALDVLLGDPVGA